MPTRPLGLVLTLGILPTVLLAQVPRDAPPPSIQNARRERDLQAVVASGGATKDTYLELTNLELTLGRFDDAAAALRGAADLEPAAPDVQHKFATIAWEHANRDVADPAGRLLLAREGVALEDRALKLKPDYFEALMYKNVLLRLQVNLTKDPSEQARLLTEADAARDRAREISGQRQATSADDARPFSGFGESYEQTAARLTPVRIGGEVHQPMKTYDVKPVYPAGAQAQRVQGVVIIEAIIDPSGSVANARILRSILPLDEAALSAVSRWQFTPTAVNGVPVAVWMTVTVNFTLQNAQ